MSQEDMMDTPKYLRIVEKKGRLFVVDINGELLPPTESQKLGNSLVNTATGKSYVYVGKRDTDGAYKIGRTEDLDRRQRELGIKFELVFECDLWGDESSVKLESALHKAFNDEWIEGEWFSLSSADISILNTIKTSPHPINTLNELKLEIEKILSELELQDGAIYWAEQAAELIRGDLPLGSMRRIAMLYMMRKTQEWHAEFNQVESAAYMLGIVNVVFTTCFTARRK